MTNEGPAPVPTGGVVRAKRPSWPAMLFGLIPFAALCFSVSIWDRIYPTVAGLPFNFFWLILWTLLTPFCMWGAYWCERRNAGDDARWRNEGRP